MQNQTWLSVHTALQFSFFMNKLCALFLLENSSAACINGYACAKTGRSCAKPSIRNIAILTAWQTMPAVKSSQRDLHSVCMRQHYIYWFYSRRHFCFYLPRSFYAFMENNDQLLLLLVAVPGKCLWPSIMVIAGVRNVEVNVWKIWHRKAVLKLEVWKRKSD